MASAMAGSLFFPPPAGAELTLVSGSSSRNMMLPTQKLSRKRPITNNGVANCVKEGKGKENGGNVHQSSPTAAFDQRTPPSPRRKRPRVPSSLPPLDVTPTAITATPAPAAIPSHAFVANIPAHVTAGTNNGSESDSSDGILEIIEMGSPPAATVALSSLRDTIHNELSRAQGSLQEEVAVAGSPNAVSATSEPSLLDSAERTINGLWRRLQRMETESEILRRLLNKGQEDWHGKLQTEYNEQKTVGERRLRQLSDTTGSLQSKIKEREEQSKLSEHLLVEKVKTLTLEKDKQVERLSQSERNVEEMRKEMLEMTTRIEEKEVAFKRTVDSVETMQCNIALRTYEIEESKKKKEHEMKQREEVIAKREKIIDCKEKKLNQRELLLKERETKIQDMTSGGLDEIASHKLLCEKMTQKLQDREKVILEREKFIESALHKREAAVGLWEHQLEERRKQAEDNLEQTKSRVEQSLQEKLDYIKQAREEANNDIKKKKKALRSEFAERERELKERSDQMDRREELLDDHTRKIVVEKESLQAEKEKICLETLQLKGNLFRQKVESPAKERPQSRALHRAESACGSLSGTSLQADTRHTSRSGAQLPSPKSLFSNGNKNRGLELHSNVNLTSRVVSSRDKSLHSLLRKTDHLCSLQMFPSDTARPTHEKIVNGKNSTNGLQQRRPAVSLTRPAAHRSSGQVVVCIDSSSSENDSDFDERYS